MRALTRIAFVVVAIGYVGLVGWQIHTVRQEPSLRHLQASIDKNNKDIVDLRAENDRLHDKLRSAGVDEGTIQSIEDGKTSAQSGGSNAPVPASSTTGGSTSNNSPQAQSTGNSGGSSPPPQPSLIQRVGQLLGL